MKKALIYIVVLVVFNACKPGKLSPEKLVEYIEQPDNGLQVTRTIEDVSYKIQYRPYEYIAALEFLKQGQVDLGQILKEVKGLRYFTFTMGSEEKQDDILKKGIPSMIEYNKRLEYYSYSAQNDFSLIEGKDTLPCVLYHFERSYNLTPDHRISLAFPEKKNSDTPSDLVLSYADKVLGTGRVNFCIEAKTINNLPHLDCQ